MHVVNSLLYAELNNRIPIVYWGKGSSYYEAAEYSPGIVPNNVFENYFEPISEYSVEDVLGKGYTYFPSYWTDSTIVDGKFPPPCPLPYTLEFPGCDADVLVSSSLQRIEDLQMLIPSNHKLSGLSRDELWHHFYSSNFHLKHDLRQRIDRFYEKNMRGGNVIGLHIRKTDKKAEQVAPYAARFLKAAKKQLSSSNDAKLFLATDCEKIVSRFVNNFPGRVVFTDSIRSTDSTAVHLAPGNKRLKGEQILMDIYLLSGCKHFIGSMASSIAFVVLYMLMDPVVSGQKSTIVNHGFLEFIEWKVAVDWYRRIKRLLWGVRRKIAGRLN